MARYKQQQQHRLSLLLNVECYTLPVTLHQHLNNLRKLYSFLTLSFSGSELEISRGMSLLLSLEHKASYPSRRCQLPFYPPSIKEFGNLGNHPFVLILIHSPFRFFLTPNLCLERNSKSACTDSSIL